MQVGDLVKYMSRTVLVIDMDDYWVYGLETGETQIGKYKRNYLKDMNRKLDIEEGE